MTVKELVYELQQLDSEFEVKYWDREDQITRSILRVKYYTDNNHGLFHYKEFPIVLLS